MIGIFCGGFVLIVLIIMIGCWRYKKYKQSLSRVDFNEGDFADSINEISSKGDDKKVDDGP